MCGRQHLAHCRMCAYDRWVHSDHEVLTAYWRGRTGLSSGVSSWLSARTESGILDLQHQGIWIAVKPASLIECIASIARPDHEKFPLLFLGPFLYRTQQMRANAAIAIVR